jgi:hypothetical protein
MPAAFAAYGIKAKVKDTGSVSKVIVSGGDAARLARRYFLYGAPLLEGGEKVINHKLAEAVKLGAEGLDIRWEGLRKRTEDGPVAADLTISEGNAAVKYNVYLRGAIELEFQSTNRSRAELAARLLRLAGIDAEVKKEGGRDVWRIEATTDMLAAGREELRKALANIVREAAARSRVVAGKAEFWLEKLEKGRVLMEGWPKYEVGLTDGALVIKFSSPNPDSIAREAQRLKEMGLEEDKHFTVKMPKGGKGYVNILKEGLAYAAWLSVYGKDEQQRRLAADFVEYILQRAKEKGEDVRKKAEEIVKEGKERGSLTLKDFKKEVEVNGKTYVVKVIGWGAEIVESQRGKKLLRLKITAEVGRVEGEHIVDRVVHEYTITYSRRGADNAAVGRTYASAEAPGGREADAERYSALIKALTGKEPKVHHLKDGRIKIGCGREHLDGFKRYAELADAIEKWLEETSRR